MSDVILGIDLGTTNSVVAVADGSSVVVLADEVGGNLIPSVVSFRPDGKILVGEEARERRLIDAKNTIYSVKRLIGRPFKSSEVRRAQERFAFSLVENSNGGVVVDIRGESYTLTEISAFVLREVRRIAEERLGHTVSKAVITVPANFNELQRSATKAAGRVAGLDVARIINEPTAAALAYGFGKEGSERVAIYDLGGGTFDLTLLELDNDVMEVVATAGDSFLGGDDFDHLVSDLMAQRFLEQHRWDPRQDPQAIERLRAAAEWAKCELSSKDLVELTVEELHYGNGGKALDLEFSMTRADLEQKIQPLLGRSFDVCNDALKEAGLKPSDLETVILVGGSTRIPLVRKMVGEYFQAEPNISIDPDLVVAQGAAIHGFAISGRPRRERKASLARVALKRLPGDEARRIRDERRARQKELPNQPAFAPDPAPAPKVPAPLAVPRPPPVAAAPRPPAPPPRAVPAPPAPPAPPVRPPMPPVAVHDDDDYQPEESTAVVSQRLFGGTDDELKAESTVIASAPVLIASMGFDGPTKEVGLPEAKPPEPKPPVVRPPSSLLGHLTEPDDFGDETTAIADVQKLAKKSAEAPVVPAPRVALKKKTPKRTLMLGQVPKPPEPEPEPATVEIPKTPLFEDALDTTAHDLPTVEVPILEKPIVEKPPEADLPARVIAAPVVKVAEPGPPPLEPALPPAAPPTPPAPPQPPQPPAFAFAPTLPEPASTDLGSGGMAALIASAAASVDEASSPVVPPIESVFDSVPPAVESNTPSVLAMPDKAPPLLMDVSPHSLGIETAGGYCQHLIRRNTPIPSEQTRVFSTAQDGQQMVRVAICQGESRGFKENQPLGVVELNGLRPAKRGDIQIEVTFIIDASGTLDVRARDLETNEQQNIRINLLGGASDADIERMRARQGAMMER